MKKIFFTLAVLSAIQLFGGLNLSVEAQTVDCNQGTCRSLQTLCQTGETSIGVCTGGGICCVGAPGGGGQGQVSCPGGTVRAGVCFPTNTGLSSQSVEVVLINFMNWLLAIFGILGIIAFVISGLQYMLASGDERTIETAKTNMKYSIIGIIVALSGFVIIQAVDAALRGIRTF